MNRRHLNLGFTLALLGLGQAHSQAKPVDPHIWTLPYDADAVIALPGAFGFQTMIQFSSDEQVQNVSIGDGESWQVTPNKAATLLFVKPIDRANPTNMTVVTDRRSYLFDLSVAAAAPYLVRFTYPEIKAATAAPLLPPPELRNTNYLYTGSQQILPAVVFDDGRVTYFKWLETSATPALFVVEADGAESIANYSVRGGYHIVERVAQRFVLRNGKQVTKVINAAWREPEPGPDAPLPGDAKTERAAVLQRQGR